MMPIMGAEQRRVEKLDAVHTTEPENNNIIKAAKRLWNAGKIIVDRVPRKMFVNTTVYFQSIR